MSGPARLRSVVEGPTCQAVGYGIGMTELNPTEMRGIEAAVLARPLRRIAKSPTKRGVVAIKWPIKAAEAVHSENDRRRQRCFAFAFSFRYDVR